MNAASCPMVLHGRTRYEDKANFRIIVLRESFKGNKELFPEFLFIGSCSLSLGLHSQDKVKIAKSIKEQKSKKRFYGKRLIALLLT